MYDDELEDERKDRAIDRYNHAFEAVGLGDYALDLSDCSAEFVEAFGMFCEAWAAGLKQR
jgi:hypothetical protein